MPDYSFREGEDEVAFQAWPSSTKQSILLHPDCTKNMWEREFPLFADDLEGLSVDERVCDYCQTVIDTDAA
jgi:hypothetical protein